MKLVVGLGNPGDSRKTDRHNVGFLLLEMFCQDRGVELRENQKYKALVGSDAVGIRYLKPLTYMNLSGFSVKGLSEYYKIPPKLILVLHDELDLSVGEVRLKRGGGTGGHNGLRSIEQSLSSKDYCRIRLGIGRPPNGKQSVTSHVLNSPTADEATAIKAGMEKILEHADDLLSGSFDRAMNSLNQSNNIKDL
ncbi:MAG: aminoacyl-tRNA hydrolase [Pseudomonadota bacterium]|nr:aminoacyl-tRNA hydrolase [Pseudomonadota bacterium]